MDAFAESCLFILDDLLGGLNFMSLSFKIGGDLRGAMRQLRKRQLRSHHAWAQSEQKLSRKWENDLHRVTRQILIGSVPLE